MDQNSSNNSNQLHFSKYHYTQVLHVLFLVIGGLLLLFYLFLTLTFMMFSLKMQIMLQLKQQN